ncbi:MAG: DNA polymerase III subunit alpha [Deltaproteobacteria bacterium]|nr:DNA polymerase III subunit alpha [Deltaproteobacteria bacterium]MBW2069838.1 DNA polymerase III subunit alpha [Deltaproteobacteria bacterium]
MKTTEFNHLHVHSEYSLLDGAIRIKDMMKAARQFGMTAVALTDHGNMYGALEFYEEANKQGVKPILGCEVYVAPKSRLDRGSGNAKERNFHLILLAENNTGYGNLMQLVTKANFEGFYYKPRVDKELLARHHEGLIAFSACLHGEIASHLLAGSYSRAENAAAEYRDIFGRDNFYLELQANGIREQELVNRDLQHLHKRTGIPLVASNDCHYLKPEDARAHDVLLCIQTGKTVSDEKRMRFSTNELFFKSPAEMAAYFVEVPEALANTVAIAERCTVELELGRYHFPHFPLAEEESPESCFEQAVYEGFARRLEKLRRGKESFTGEKEEEYRQRLAHEIAVIKKMGFSTYFLIVADFVNFAKKNRIPVGPGRGSAAGSLVAYCLGITDLDPIAHGLIFERFLNEERLSLPDIDVDFCIKGRDRVLQYVSERYGKERVAQIITFGTMQARAVIRDVGRALGMSYGEVDRIAKLIPASMHMTLERAFKEEPRLQELAREAGLQELFAAARSLEGLTRHASTHAAGVVISDKPIVEYMPLYKGTKGEVVTQYSMKYVEKAGLIKFDFLGLRNLTVIDNAIQLIEKNHGISVDILNIPMDDRLTYELLCRGDTTGVFQLESSGMRDLAARLRPENFNDIIALIALYRPGPLESGMVNDFIRAKHGEMEVSYEIEALRDILQDTYGVILYQEQVMKIASVLANYTLGEADILRRAMGKKIPEVMAAQRDRFLSGARENGIDLDKAAHIFDLMEKFAGYGFNKSHSAAYALIAYQTAYLKAHYPLEFMAALLNSFLGNSDNLVKLLNECRDKGLQVLPPDVNLSEWEFTVVGDSIRFGLGAVKNVGAGAVDSIVEARQEGPFLSLYDFCERVDLQKVNRRVLESLIKCGSFDSLHPRRSQVFAALDEAMDMAQAIQKDRLSGQMSMFGTFARQSPERTPPLPEVPAWTSREKLAMEKEALGFYVSGHPLNDYQKELAAFDVADTSILAEKKDGSQVTLCGIKGVLKEITTKRGDRMAFLTLEDRQGSVEVVLFSDVYRQNRECLERDEPLLIMGTVQQEEKGTKVIGQRLFCLSEAREKLIRAIRLRLNAEALDKANLQDLKAILERHRGDCVTYLHMSTGPQCEAVIRLADNLRVKPDQSFVAEVNQYFGEKVVSTVLINGNDHPRNFPPRKKARRNGNYRRHVR